MKRLFDSARKKKTRARLTRYLDYFVRNNGQHIVLVAKRTYGYSGNLRMVGDYLATYTEHSVYLYYEGELDPALKTHLNQVNIVHLSTFSYDNMHLILSARTVVVDHSIWDCYIGRKKIGRHVFNLWHGVPIKRIETAIENLPVENRNRIEINATIYEGMIASGAIDRMAISSSFRVPYLKVHPHGLPRYEILFQESLPRDLQQQEEAIRQQKRGQKLLLFAPTFRQHHESPCVQNQELLRKLAIDIKPLGYQLGIRTHQYDKSADIFKSLDNIELYTPQTFPETNIVLRNTDILLTDFSSLWVDFLIMNRPIIGFASDFAQYRDAERNFLYDFDTIFPGPFLSTGEKLIETVVSTIKHNYVPDYEYQKRILLPGTLQGITEKVCKEILAL